VKTISRTLWLLSLIGICGVLPRPAQAGQADCWADESRARARAARVLTSPELSVFRATHSIAADASDLRVLSDDRDQAVCQQLNALVGLGRHGRPVYYSAGGFYFVSAVPGTNPTPNRIISRPMPVAVLDGAFAVVEVLAM
jgi:hypothetical protein